MLTFQFYKTRNLGQGQHEAPVLYNQLSWPSILNVAKCSSLQNQSTDVTEIWPIFLPGMNHVSLQLLSWSNIWFLKVDKKQEKPC